MFEKFKMLLLITVAMCIGLASTYSQASTTNTDSFSVLEKVESVDGEFFELELIDDIKVAPRDPHDRCKTHPESQPYCKKKVKKKEETISIAKLKCQKAKTCDTEPSLLERLRRLLT